jgi:hypothetical protein
MLNEFDTIAFKTEKGDTIYVETTAAGNEDFIIPEGINKKRNFMVGDKLIINEEALINKINIPDSLINVEKKRLPRRNRKDEPKIEQAMSVIGPIANGIIRAIDDIDESKRPSEFEVSLKASFASGLGLKIVTLSSQANLDIKLSWKKSN